MRHITIHQVDIDDAGKGVEYKLFLDSDNEYVFKHKEIIKVMQVAEDYLTTKEYKTDFIRRLVFQYED